MNYESLTRKKRGERGKRTFKGKPSSAPNVIKQSYSFNPIHMIRYLYHRGERAMFKKG